MKTLLGLAEVEVNAAPLPTRKAEANTRVAAGCRPLRSACAACRGSNCVSLSYSFYVLFRECMRIRIRVCNILCSHDPPAI